MYNPWKGLAAYEEPQDNNDKQYLFCGRDKATRELTYLIENQLCVTLYGRTGIGKTSLLQAGIFPRLRKNNYLPILVRLGIMPQENKQSAYAGYITQRIEEEIKRFNGEIKHNDRTKQETSPNATDYLWAYFATRRFFIQDKEVFPVIVLDQFEENFINHKEQVWLLLEQIYSLIDDNKLFPDGFHNETIFRLVISIREDDLYRLEDSIDILHLSELKSNRYRLTRLTEEEAQDIIIHPGSSCLPHDTAQRDEITKAIIAMVKKWNDGNINTLALSLSCSILYDKAADRNSKQPILNLNDIYETESNNPLTDFYATIISSLPQKERYFLEDNLVDENGRRNTVNSHVMDSNCPHWRNFLAGTYRILQENNDKVELVHDMLAKAIYEARLQREKKKQSRFLQIVGIFIVAIIFLLAILGTTFDITGKDPSRLPVFPTPKVVIDANDTMLTNYTAKEIIWNGNGELLLGICPSLEYLTITNNYNIIHTDVCPNLRYIIFENDSCTGGLSLHHCPSLKHINLPTGISFSQSLNGTTQIESVTFHNSDKYVKLDGILWNIKRKEIESLSTTRKNKREAYFPFEMRDDTYTIYQNDTIYNCGLWIDNLLFNKDTTYIISSHNPIDPVLDLTRYPKLRNFAYFDEFEPLTSEIFSYNTDITKIILNKNLGNLDILLSGLQKLDTIVIPASINKAIDLNIGKEITYIIDSTNTRLKKVNGIVYEDKKPVLLSAEYKNSYFITRSFNNIENDSTTIFLSKGYYCEFSDKHCNEYGIRPNINMKKLTNNKPNYYKYYQYNNATFIHFEKYRNHTYIYNNKKDIILPTFVKGLNCTHISPSTENIYILGYDPVYFINLNDSIKKNITLYTAFGVNHSQYATSKFHYGFKAIRELDLFTTIKLRLINTYNNTLLYFQEHPLVLTVFISCIFCILILFYKLNLKLHHKFIRKKRIYILHSIITSLTMTLIALFAWIASYWFIYNFSFGRNTIIATIIASLSTVCVWHGIYYNVLFQLKRTN